MGIVDVMEEGQAENRNLKSRALFFDGIGVGRAFFARHVLQSDLPLPHMVKRLDCSGPSVHKSKVMPVQAVHPAVRDGAGSGTFLQRLFLTRR